MKRFVFLTKVVGPKQMGLALVVFQWEGGAKIGRQAPEKRGGGGSMLTLATSSEFIVLLQR